MDRCLLPVGIQSFRRIREGGFYYVDKTALIRQLVGGGDHYFLSRPRRFGKSLLIDTLQELFEGNEPLFRGLDIHEHWDWSVQHPVVRLSFGGKHDEPGDLACSISNQLASLERQADLETVSPILINPERLRNLLEHLHQTTGKQAVVLVDEYDKPILDVLKNPELAEANRDYLRGFYGIIKDSAKHVRFVFVTGVSMFSKVSLFSGLNNLKDISLNPQYATICGYTDEDIDTVFAPELPGLDRDEIRSWYNGYSWCGEENLYNPFGVLLLFDSRKFQPHWFETATPTFLYQLMRERNVNPLELESQRVDAARLSKLDVGDMDLHALMFQTGYLTIAGEERIEGRSFYRLEYPNREVRQSLSEGLLELLGGEKNGGEYLTQARILLDRLESNDFEGFTESLQSYMAGLPHQWWGGAGRLGEYEAHYAAMLYMLLCGVGAQVQPEESSSQGRSDLVIRHGGQVFVLEFKLAADGGGVEAVLDAALSQIRERGYAEKYQTRGEPVHLLGLAFGKEDRTLLGLRAEKLVSQP